MTTNDDSNEPSGHTDEGGVLVGAAGASRLLVVFEDPQCPYCREFEELNGATMAAAVASASLAIDYRMRCFLGPESVRADNALALAAEEGGFDALRRTLFAEQPPEGTGGFTAEDLIALGARVGLTSRGYVSGVRGGRYERWVRRRDDLFASEDPNGTPAAWLDGVPLGSDVLFDAEAFRRLLRPR